MTATTPMEIPFGPLTIAFDHRILRPRPWTAEQSVWAAEILRTAPDGAVLELCAGAGQIGLLTIALEPRPLVCVDVDPAACAYIAANAEAAGLRHLVDVRRGRIEEAVREGERFALVVADPPWVPRAETGRYPEDPLVAIDGGDDGLDIAWACVGAIADHLVVGGSAVLQLGTPEQADAVTAGLAPHPELRVTEVRECERGVLVRIDR